VATRIDVLHSPFVFKLYNACIKSNHTQSTLVASLANHLNLKSTFTVSTEEDIKTLLQLNSMYDLIIIKTDTFLSSDSLYQISIRLSKNGCLLIEKPYISPSHKYNTRNLSALPNFHVTIDLFRCALLFQRSEQVREYFRLRW
jgi:hypothetical protein